MPKLNRAYNLAKTLHRNKIPVLPRLIVNINRILFSCDIPLKSEIHSTVIFAHNGLGVVIHEKAKIGKNTKILQNVAIGGNLGKERLIDGVKTTAPVIGENVLIGAGAKVLGPVKVGNNAKIGAGAVVMIDVPDNAIAVGIPAKIKYS